MVVLVVPAGVDWAEDGADWATVVVGCVAALAVPRAELFADGATSCGDGVGLVTPDVALVTRPTVVFVAEISLLPEVL